MRQVASGSGLSLNELWSLDPSIRHLNHGSFGACPIAVLAEQARVRSVMERDTMGFFVDELQPRLDTARAVVAEFVGADPAGLAFVDNATTAVNAVLRGLEFVSGDEILTLEQGYPACHNAAEFVAKRWGATVVYAPIPVPLESPQQVVDSVLSRVTPRTRLALLDHIVSPTGLIMPLAALVAALKERGVRVLVDGAHAPGSVPVDLTEVGADWYTGNAHKWLCAPKGAAFLHAAGDVRDRTRPLVISHGARAPLGGRSRYHLEFDWTGTRDPSACLAIPKAIEVIGGALPGGFDAVMAHNNALVQQGLDVVAQATGAVPVGPPSMMASMAAMLLPAEFGEPDSPFSRQRVATWLRRRGFVVQMVPWSSRRRWILRLSAHLYNATSDYFALAETLADGLPDRPWTPPRRGPLKGRTVVRTEVWGR